MKKFLEIIKERITKVRKSLVSFLNEEMQKTNSTIYYIVLKFLKNTVKVFTEVFNTESEVSILGKIFCVSGSLLPIFMLLAGHFILGLALMLVVVFYYYPNIEKCFNTKKGVFKTIIKEMF